MKPVEFAFPGPLRDALVAAVLDGRKTTTTGLHLDDEDLSTPGERFLVLDSAERAVGVIETVESRVCTVADIDTRHAIDEGEDYDTVAGWRAEHEKFWHSKEVRDELGDPEFTVDDATPVHAWRFRLVERYE